MEISLLGFLAPDKYSAVYRSMEHSKLETERPPDRYKLLTVVSSCPQLFSLSNLTGLELHELAPGDSNGGVRLGLEDVQYVWLVQ